MADVVSELVSGSGQSLGVISVLAAPTSVQHENISKFAGPTKDQINGFWDKRVDQRQYYQT